MNLKLSNITYVYMKSSAVVITAIINQNIRFHMCWMHTYTHRSTLPQCMRIHITEPHHLIPVIFGWLLVKSSLTQLLKNVSITAFIFCFWLLSTLFHPEMLLPWLCNPSMFSFDYTQILLCSWARSQCHFIHPRLLCNWTFQQPNTQK